MVNKGIYVTEKKGVTFLFFGSYRNSCISNPEACGPEGETFINSDWLFFCCLIVFFSNHCSFRPWNEIQSIFRPAVTFAVSWPGLFVDKVIHRDTHRTVLCFWDRYFTFVWVGTSGWGLWLCTAVPWFDTLLWQKGTAAQGQAQEPQCGQGWAQEGPLLQLPALETPNEVQVPSGDQDFGFQQEELLRHSAVSWLRSRDAELGEGLFIGVYWSCCSIVDFRNALLVCARRWAVLKSIPTVCIVHTGNFLLRSFFSFKLLSLAFLRSNIFLFLEDPRPAGQASPCLWWTSHFQWLQNLLKRRWRLCGILHPWQCNDEVESKL